MKFIADFHIHSHYSIATSKDLIPEYLDLWGRIKGIKVIGTGDFTHPGWLKELQEKLEPAEQGLFRLKNKYKINEHSLAPEDDANEIRFLLSAEISSIYKKYDKVRKVHNLIFAPGFETVEKIQNELSKIGNITSDGRPILGLDSRDLFEIALECSEDIFFVPAHIWTPWFSALGDKSGFDTIEECYGDLTDYIFAVETGLSSDPPMNWMCSFLDKFTLISNSDAHSPEKLGREANLFDTKLNYNSIINAIKTGDVSKFLGTVEFFPQEGKYHHDGHRKCGICWDPLKTFQNDGICPVCGKKITIGVANRVMQLSDRKGIEQKENYVPYYSTIPLKEILGEIKGVSQNTKMVKQIYNSLIQKVGSEFDILMNKPLGELKLKVNDVLYEAIKRMREGKVFVKEGYDGEFGQIKVFSESESKSFHSQKSIFEDIVSDNRSVYNIPKGTNFDIVKYGKMATNKPEGELVKDENTLYKNEDTLEALNTEQLKATEHSIGPALIIAGPGTGKTKVLCYRIAYLIQQKNVYPKKILAVTFTNKAANEMRERIEILLNKDIVSDITVCTFHSLGYSILKEHSAICGRNKNFTIIDEDDREDILKKEIGEKNLSLDKILKIISEAKQNLKSSEEIEDENISVIFNKYGNYLRENNLFDLDDLIYFPVKCIMNNKSIINKYRQRFQWILIDEYQDINFAQYQLIKNLTNNSKANLFVIGDTNQAIYGFRGADIQYIQKFAEDFPETAVYKLKQSYRCSDSILKASSEVIRIDKTNSLHGLYKGVKINISQQNSDKSEAEFVARTIEHMIGGLRFFSIDSNISGGDEHSEITNLSDFVVLCRINKQLKVLEKAFNDHSIPYQTIGDKSLFKQKPLKSIINLLKYCLSPDNCYLKNKLISENILNQKRISLLAEIIRKQQSVNSIINAVIDNFFNKAKLKNENHFKIIADLSNSFGNNLEDFLKFVALGNGIDVYDRRVEKVTLMTLHAAKGLEFNCVFIIGCEDGLIPYSLLENKKPDLDEENRLLYVGMTRAKKYLYLSHAKKRLLFGKHYHLQKSPFLDRIEKEVVELSESKYKRKGKKEDNQLSLF